MTVSSVYAEEIYKRVNTEITAAYFLCVFFAPASCFLRVLFGVIRTKHGKGPKKVRTKPEQVPFLLPAGAEKQTNEMQCNPAQQEATNSKALQAYTRKQHRRVLIHATAPHCKRLQKKAIAKNNFQNL